LHRAWWAVCADSCSLEIAFDSTMGVKRDWLIDLLFELALVLLPFDDFIIFCAIFWLAMILRQT
jgi:hypothetical protein